MPEVGSIMKIYDVFTPTGVPTVTYINREEQDLERQLRNALATPGQIVSLAGPSKSGKTVLINKVIPRDNLIALSGAAIRSAEMLWDRVLNWMEAPSETTASSEHETGAEIAGKAGGKIGIPFVAEGSTEASAAGHYAYTKSNAKITRRGGIDQVVKELSGSDFIVFIDDFHYMRPDTQVDVAKQIKEAAEKGVKVCTASVPHRTDDVVRSNPELRGRVRAIDFTYWKNEEIALIANKGFEALGMGVDPAVVTQLATEAFGSPQLMQQICLQLCFYTRIEATLNPSRPIPLNGNELSGIFEQASTTTDFTSLLESLHGGPKQHGSRRNSFELTDGTKGDVYRCILLGLAQDPPHLSFTYDDIYLRVRKAGVKDAPAGSSVAQALDRISELAGNTERGAIVEWKDDVLDIVDPYFLYYLRRSPKLAALGQG